MDEAGPSNGHASDAEPESRRICTAELNFHHFIEECERYGTSDRAAAALATALLEDLNIKDEDGNPIIIDVATIRRARQKYRENNVEADKAKD